MLSFRFLAGGETDKKLLEMKMAMMMFIVLPDAKKYKNQN